MSKKWGKIVQFFLPPTGRRRFSGSQHYNRYMVKPRSQPAYLQVRAIYLQKRGVNLRVCTW